MDHLSYRGALLALLVAAVTGLSCGPSEEDCRQLCDWAALACTADEGCMDDCLEADSGDVDYALQQCPGSPPRSCKSANCCLRFTYSAYYWQHNCL